MEVETNWLIKTGEAQEALGLKRQLFNRLTPRLFSLLLNGTSHRFPADYIMGLQQHEGEFSKVAAWADSFAQTEVALQLMQTSPTRYMGMIARKAVDNAIWTRAFGEIASVSAQTIRDWRQREEDQPLQASVHGAGRGARLMIPLLEIERISEWQYPVGLQHFATDPQHGGETAE